MDVESGESAFAGNHRYKGKIRRTKDTNEGSVTDVFKFLYPAQAKDKTVINNYWILLKRKYTFLERLARRGIVADGGLTIAKFEVLVEISFLQLRNELDSQPQALLELCKQLGVDESIISKLEQHYRGSPGVPFGDSANAIEEKGAPDGPSTRRVWKSVFPDGELSVRVDRKACVGSIEDTMRYVNFYTASLGDLMWEDLKNRHPHLEEKVRHTGAGGPFASFEALVEIAWLMLRGTNIHHRRVIVSRVCGLLSVDVSLIDALEVPAINRLDRVEIDETQKVTDAAASQPIDI